MEGHVSKVGEVVESDIFLIRAPPAEKALRDPLNGSLLLPHRRLEGEQIMRLHVGRDIEDRQVVLGEGEL